MSKFKIVNLIDKIFISSSIFLILYAWINFFIRDLWTTFFLSLIFSFGVIYLLFHLLEKKQHKKSMSKQHLINIEKNFLAFRLLNENDKINLLKLAISKNFEIKQNNKILTYKKDGKLHQILIATEHERLSQFELINLLSKVEKNISVVEIICSQIEANLNTKILKNLEVEIITKEKLFEEIFLKNNTFPSIENLQTENKKTSLKNFAKNFFLPQKSKGFFIAGLILIFSSIILPFHTYYLIFGTVLLIFSIVCKLLPIIVC